MINITDFPIVSFEIYPSKEIYEILPHVPKDPIYSITSSPAKGFQNTLDLAKYMKEIGLNVRVHVAARSIPDKNTLKYISEYLNLNKLNDIFVIGGDQENFGYYNDAYSLLLDLNSLGLKYSSIGLAGYPEGHPKISENKLISKLKDKTSICNSMTDNTYIISQMCFDKNSIVSYSKLLSENGILNPLYVGLSGYCNFAKLYKFSLKCGVGDSIKFLKGRNRLIANLRKFIFSSYSPVALMKSISLEVANNSPVCVKGYHIYTFNNLIESVKKISRTAS